MALHNKLEPIHVQKFLYVSSAGYMVPLINTKDSDEQLIELRYIYCFAAAEPEVD